MLYPKTQNNMREQLFGRKFEIPRGKSLTQTDTRNENPE